MAATTTRIPAVVVQGLAASASSGRIALVVALVVAGAAITQSCNVSPTPGSDSDATTTVGRPVRVEATSEPTETPLPTQTATATPCAAVQHPLARGAIPSGAMVAWGDCSGIWLLEGEPPSRRLGEVAAPSSLRVSPDRRHAAVETETEDGRVDLYVVALDGGGLRKVVDGTELAERVPVADDMPEEAATTVKYFDWLPDGSGLAFTTWEVYFPPDVMGTWRYRDDLWTVPVDGGEMHSVLPPGKGGHFAYSPDGERVALTRLRSKTNPAVATVAVANADGSEYRVLLEHSPVGSETDWLPYALPQWTPDGEHLLIAVPDLAREPPGVATGDDWAYFDSPVQLLRLSLDGSTELVARASGGSIPWDQNYNGYWSPDGNMVAYLAPPEGIDDTPTAEAYPMAPPALSAPEPATLVIARTDLSLSVSYDTVTYTLRQFNWSPDGQRFAYRVWDFEGAEWPLKMGHLGQPPRTIPSADATWSVHWLDGSLLLLGGGERIDLLSIDEDGRIAERAVVLSNVGSITMDVAAAP